MILLDREPWQIFKNLEITFSASACVSRGLISDSWFGDDLRLVSGSGSSGGAIYFITKVWRFIVLGIPLVEYSTIVTNRTTENFNR